MSIELADLHRWIAPLGWALLHFAWQGAIVAAVAWALLTLARGPRLRYAIGCAAMAIMLALPLATLAWIGPDPRPLTITPDSLLQVAGEPARGSLIGLTTPLPAALTAPLAPPTLRDRVAATTPAVVFVWLTGVAMLAIYHLAGLAQLARLRRHAAPILDAVWRDRLRDLSTRLGLRRAVRLCATTRLDCPAVVGAFRPVILWPAAALTGLTPTQVEALLAHELAHVCRHDYLVNLLQTLVETLLFYHPAVWWISRRVRQEREHCCDDLAASVVGDRAAYAGALVAMESLRSTPPFALGAAGGSLLARVRRLLAPTAPRRRWSPAGLGVIIMTLALVGLFACKPDAPAAATQSATTIIPAADRYDRLARQDLTLARLVAQRRRLDTPVRLDAQARGEQAGGETMRLAKAAIEHEIESRAATIETAAPADTDADRAYRAAIAARDAERVEERHRSLDAEIAAMLRGDAPYHVGGHVARPGVYTFQTPRVILREAIATAGDLDMRELDASSDDVWILVIARTAPTSEAFLTFALSDVRAGKHDDFWLAADDQVMVGVTPPKRVTTRPQSSATLAADFDDRIASGDLLRVTINDLAATGKPEIVVKRVAADGTITLPYFKSPFVLKGMTIVEAERRIATAYEKARILSDANVGVLVVQSADGRSVPAGLFEPLAAPAAVPANAAANAPTRDRSMILPGDLIQVKIADIGGGSGVAQVEYKNVPADGRISLPYLSTIAVGNRSVVDAERAIAKAYADAQILTNASVSLLVVQDKDGRPLVPAAVLGGTDDAPADSKAKADATAEVQALQRKVRALEEQIARTPARSDAAPEVTLDLATPPATTSRSPLQSPTATSALDAADPYSTQARAAAHLKTQGPVIDGMSMPPSAAAPTTAPPMANEMPLATTRPTAPMRQVPPPVGSDAMPAAKPFDSTTPRQLAAATAAVSNEQRIEALRAELARLTAKEDGTADAHPAVPSNEYYVGGRIQRPGVYSLGNRAISLKQALISAGLLDRALVDDRAAEYRAKVPVRIEVIRREGDGRELRLVRDFAKLFDGREADVMLRPDDQILVGAVARRRRAPPSTAN